MKIIRAFFQLIRWRNLIIVFLTQWFIWQCVIHPMVDWNMGAVFLTPVHFLLLSFSTLLIAAAGYIINDYFDVKIDVINRPQKVIVDKIISRRAAILWHSFFNVTGFLLAIYLARKLDNYYVVLIQLTCTLLLWFYSTHFKRQLLTGNIVVSILAALTVLVLQVYKPELKGDTKLIMQQQAISPDWILYGYAFFAFMLTWMREIVKDMEDVKGDAEQGCKTLPIKMGLEFTAQFVRVLGAFTLLVLGAASIFVFKLGYIYLGIYTALGVILPLLWLTFTLGRVNTTTYFAIASRWLKIIMIAGICSLIVYHFSK